MKAIFEFIGSMHSRYKNPQLDIPKSNDRYFFLYDLFAFKLRNFLRLNSQLQSQPVTAQNISNWLNLSLSSSFFDCNRAMIWKKGTKFLPEIDKKFYFIASTDYIALNGCCLQFFCLLLLVIVPFIYAFLCHLRYTIE